MRQEFVELIINNMDKCKYCGKELLAYERSSHYCPTKRRVLDRGDDFLISLALGAATNSALLGGLLGGDIAGGIVGDLLNGGDLFD